MDEANIRMEVIEERFSKFEDRSIEVIQSSEKKEKDKKKLINRKLQTCGTISEYLTYV